MNDNCRIKKIEIKNIKGFKNYQFSPNQYLIPNKPNLFVAPNGFGKSSITTAFNALLKTKIKLSPLEYREQNFDYKPCLSIITSDEYGNNEQNFYADENKNTINSMFEIEVINSPLKAKKKSLGGGTSYAVIDIEPLIIWNTIPKKENLSYSVREYRKAIKKNSHIFKNLKFLFNNKKFICEFKNKINYKSFELKKRQKILLEFKEQLSELSLKEIKNFENVDITKLKNINDLTEIANLIKKYSDEIKDIKDLYIQSIQVIDIILSLPSIKFNNIYKYYSYCLEKEKFKSRINNFNNAWLKLELLEKKGKLVAEFPNPSLISNGQRDILVFIAKLLKAEVKLHGDNSILIIDEIFDYLDEANLVSAQYYINKFIETFKEKNKKNYVIIMTHLDPVVFRSYYFKNLHVYYLTKSQRKPNEKIIEKLLIYRNKKENKFTDEQIDDISKYYLHYNPNNYEPIEIFDRLNLNKIHTKTDFISYIKNHYELYKNENRTTEYDPLAVCCFVRLKIEKSLYDRLENDSKDKFLDCHTTIEKIRFIEDLGGDVSEHYYLLNIIHNEAIHCKNNTDNYTRLYSKLENLIIRQLILSI